MLMLYRASSLATRAVRLSGLFAVTLSHNVLTFQEAKVSILGLFELLLLLRPRRRDPRQLR